MNQRKPQELIDAIKVDLDKGKLSQRKIAKKHGVSQSYVGKIKKEPVISVEEGVDPTDQRILKLEAQTLALKDERNRLKRAYQATQRKNSVFEALVDEMQTCITPIKELPKIRHKKSNGKLHKESLVMMLSDEHADSVILPHQVGGLERFNFPIALRRAEEYVDTVIRFTQNTLTNYDFHTLWIIANGDHSSGEIHKAVDHSYYRNQFRNSLAIGQMHALMFRELSQVFPKINILYLPGNHGRRSTKKDYYGAWDNWDYLIAEIAKQHCTDLKNVDFLIPESFSANVEIEGYGFCVTHGDDVRSWNGIPWYGIERKTRRWAALNAAIDKKIHCFCFGHFHNPAEQMALNGETIINGSWVACDPYAFDSLTTFTEPAQKIFGVHRERGISWRLNVKLKTEREHLGPNRYSVLLANKELKNE